MSLIFHRTFSFIFYLDFSKEIKAKFKTLLIMCLSHSFLNINPELIVLDCEIYGQGMNIPFYQQFLGRSNQIILTFLEVLARLRPRHNYYRYFLVHLRFAGRPTSQKIFFDRCSSIDLPLNLTLNLDKHKYAT
jgi:hypothetical protein